MKTILLYLSFIITCSVYSEEVAPSWQSNYVHPELFGNSAPLNDDQLEINPYSAEVTGFLIELHNEANADELVKATQAFKSYVLSRQLPLEQIIDGHSSAIFYLRKKPERNLKTYYDQFGRVVSWFMLNHHDSIVSIRPILKDQTSHPFDPDRAIWMEPAMVRKGNRAFKEPEKTIIDGFHIHVDYLPGQQEKANVLKEAYKKRAAENGIIFSALDDYPEKVNGPHVRAGWEIKFEKAGATVFDRYGYSLAWLLLNHQDIPVYSHPKTWIFGENEERLISHLDSSLYIGATPLLNQWFFFNPEVNSSGLYRWDEHIPKYRKPTKELSSLKQAQILEFWFGNEKSDYPLEKSKLWFSKQKQAKNTEFDKLIRDTFQQDLVLGSIGAYQEWEKTPEGRLALIILLDQFPRNMFRGTPMAFAYDRIALALAKQGIEKGDDKKLTPAQRLFFYLPFIHSENLEDQNQGVALQEQLKEEVNVNLKEIFNEHYRMALLHREAVKIFGRLPSRNDILGRESTPEERSYLENPQRHF